MNIFIERFWFILILINQLNQYKCDPGYDYKVVSFLNRTTPSQRQLYEFKFENPEPVGVLTTSYGSPVEVRDTISLNTNQYKNPFHIDLMSSFTNERIPERVVHAKGGGAWGYFILKNDISNYTSADIFNGVGKITPAFARFSKAMQNLGGSDLERELNGLGVKFYTKEGNLDFLCINLPSFFIRDPLLFPSFVAASKRNPKTNRKSFTMLYDFLTKRAESFHTLFWLLSDYGLPNGYRKADYFPIHTYEINNKHGDKYFVRFNFRTCQGIENLSNSEAKRIASIDPDYFNNDLYDAIEYKNYPIWNLEMDVMTYSEVVNCDYDPFDFTRTWKKGTYDTVTIGKLILNKNPDNFFRDVELAAMNPGNLVPGIPGPIDSTFRLRRFSYRDAQIHRLGINHNKIPVNSPLYRKEYNKNGLPPVLENMDDVPVYYPNSFNGPVPYVDETRAKYSFGILHSQAVDLDIPASFYKTYVVSHAQKERFVNNTVDTLLAVAPYIQKRVVRLFSLIDYDLGNRLTERLIETEEEPTFSPPDVLLPPSNLIASCN